jgi:hypothetical protein
MKRQVQNVGRGIGFILLAVLLLGAAVATAQAPAATTTTTITVTSAADDYTDGNSKKCSDFPAEPCTLRRAINQAYSLSSDARPVYINFDIPTSDPGYNPTLQVWKIQLAGTTAYPLRDLYGLTIVDGSTQPGGRTGGPKIIIDGQGSKNYGFITRQNGNEIRGLAMQNFNTAHISVSSSDNLIEDCWFGLSDDGMTLSSGNDTDREGGSGVALSASISGNTIRHNVITGFFGVAAAIRGDDNVFSGNWIGTRADGTVPIPAQFDQHPCLSGAWVGGSGITVADNDNQIGGPTTAEGNLFAGIFLDVAAGTTQRPAMDVSGYRHVIQNNIIGLDANGDVVGVCGRGIDLGNEPQNAQILNNTIVEPALSGILMNGSLINGNMLRGNIIKRQSAWPGAQGFNNFPENAIAHGLAVPEVLRNFEPAQVLEIDGVNVSGTSGAGSFCPLCTIELLLDDTDSVTETLQSLAVITADAGGHWVATLSAPLETGQGLRTLSTVPDTFTIIGLDTGTTSKLSELYRSAYRVCLPLVLRNK